MPIEKAPANPVRPGMPSGGLAYRVKTGDDLGSVARANRMSVDQLCLFNFGTTNPAEINWYLRSRVGCRKATADGKNWMFTSDANPGVIYIPVASVPVINIQHPVTLFPQPTNMSCWSAAATMLFGDRSIGPGGAHLTHGGLDNDEANVETFARAHNLKLHYPQSWTIPGLAELLRKGPVMLAGGLLRDAAGKTHGHAVVVAGMVGDGTDAGTALSVYDPWPPGRGQVSPSVSYLTIMLAFPRATTYVLQR